MQSVIVVCQIENEILLLWSFFKVWSIFLTNWYPKNSEMSCQPERSPVPGQLLQSQTHRSDPEIDSISIPTLKMSAEFHRMYIRWRELCNITKSISLLSIISTKIIISMSNIKGNSVLSIYLSLCLFPPLSLHLSIFSIVRIFKQRAECCSNHWRVPQSLHLSKLMKDYGEDACRHTKMHFISCSLCTRVATLCTTLCFLVSGF